MFQVLSAPKGSLSWQEYDGKIPRNAIFAGRLFNSPDSYVCRGWIDDKKTVLATGYFTNMKCWVARCMLNHIT